MSASANGPHVFDQRITPITWAYQWGTEENLYTQYGFSPLNAEASSVRGDLDWKIVSKVLGLVNDSTHRDHRPTIQTFVTNMVKHSADADAVQTIINLDISTEKFIS